MKKQKVKITISGDSRKGKCWAKLVTSVNVEKTGGYMFEGEFLKSGEQLLPLGSLLLFVETEGSWKNRRQVASLARVHEGSEVPLFVEFDNGGVQMGQTTLDNLYLDWHTNKISVAEKCQELLQENQAANQASMSVEVPIEIVEAFGGIENVKSFMIQKVERQYNSLYENTELSIPPKAITEE